MPKNSAIIFLEDFQKSLKNNRIITVLSYCIGVIAIICSFVFTSVQVRDLNSKIYVLDHGSVLLASRENNEKQRDLEAIDHVTRFHEIFFNVVPNVESINRNIDRALALSDKSVMQLCNDLKEQSFYATMIRNNAIQQIVIDSVRVNMNHYPYTARTWAKIYLIRMSNITQYDFESSCELCEVNRTEGNPHGLLIQRYRMDKNEKIEQRTRKN